MDNKQTGGGRYDQFAKPEGRGQFPTKIERGDLRPYPIRPGETEIVLQRHGKYIREKDDPKVGSLTPEAVEAEKKAATDFLEAFLSQFPAEERSAVALLIVSSDTQYLDGGKRSYETAELVQESAEEVFQKQGIPTENIVNTAHELKGEGGPRVMPRLREPNFFNDSPDFLGYMMQKYGGINLAFWEAFEKDVEKETREKMGAEGPDDIADRMSFTVRALKRYSDLYHGANPGRRLIIWAATHYDTISPFVKRDVFGVSKDETLMVDYGAGVSLRVDTAGAMTTEIAGKEYPVALTKGSSDSRES